MEVGEQAVDHAEAVAGRDEERRLAAPRRSRSSPSAAADSSARRLVVPTATHAPAARARRVDRVHRWPAALRTARCACGARARSLMRAPAGRCRRRRAASHRRVRRPRARSASSMRLVEMQSRRRRGHRARRARVHRLVARLVGLHPPRVRCRAAAAPCRVDRAASKTSSRYRRSAREEIRRCRSSTVARTSSARMQHAARPRRMARAHLRQRVMGVEHALDQHLDPAAAGLASQQARLDHARVVEHEHVARLHQLRQVAKQPIRQRAACAVQMQQPARAALRRRKLRDQLGRQFVVEVVEFAWGRIIAAASCTGC